MRDISVRISVIWTILPVMACMLCSCESTAQRAIAMKVAGQRSIPNEYVKMWDQTFSEEQWLEMLRQRIHQPIAVWQGIDAGWIGEGGGGLSFRGLMFRESRSLVLEEHLRRHDLLLQHPLLFLRLFEDPDPETVLTGVAAYRLAEQRDVVTACLDTETQDRIADAFRKLLLHLDVRVRWAAVYTLAQNGWLTPQDVQRGLDDETSDIRATTAFCLGPLMGWLSDPRGSEGPLDATDRLTPQQAQARRASLAPILLDHVNDPHFFVRFKAGGALYSIFDQRIRDLEATGVPQNVPALPKRFDWVGVRLAISLCRAERMEAMVGREWNRGARPFFSREIAYRTAFSGR
ncbi:MAG: HEAT repeat domain-containing protein [Solirubrobacterales bacterium]